MTRPLNTFTKMDHQIRPIHHSLFSEFIEHLAIDLDGTHQPVTEEGTAHKSAVTYKSETGTVEIGLAIDITQLDENGNTALFIDGSDFDENEEDLFQDFLCVVENVIEPFVD